MSFTRSQLAAAHPAVASFLIALCGDPEAEDDKFLGALDGVLLTTGAAEAGARLPEGSVFGIELADAARRRASAALAAQFADKDLTRAEMYPFLSDLSRQRLPEFQWRDGDLVSTPIARADDARGRAAPFADYVDAAEDGRTHLIGMLILTCPNVRARDRAQVDDPIMLARDREVEQTRSVLALETSDSDLGPYAASVLNERLTAGAPIADFCKSAGELRFLLRNISDMATDPARVMRSKVALLLARDATLRATFAGGSRAPDALATRVEAIAEALAARDARGGARNAGLDARSLWSATGMATLARQLAAHGGMHHADLIDKLRLEADAHGSVASGTSYGAYVQHTAELRAAMGAAAGDPMRVDLIVESGTSPAFRALIGMSAAPGAKADTLLQEAARLQDLFAARMAAVIVSSGAASVATGAQLALDTTLARKIARCDLGPTPASWYNAMVKIVRDGTLPAPDGTDFFTAAEVSGRISFLKIKYKAVAQFLNWQGFDRMLECLQKALVDAGPMVNRVALELAGIFAAAVAEAHDTAAAQLASSDVAAQYAPEFCGPRTLAALLSFEDALVFARRLDGANRSSGASKSKSAAAGQAAAAEPEAKKPKGKARKEPDTAAPAAKPKAAGPSASVSGLFSAGASGKPQAPATFPLTPLAPEHLAPNGDYSEVYEDGVHFRCATDVFEIATVERAVGPLAHKCIAAFAAASRRASGQAGGADAVRQSRCPTPDKVGHQSANDTAHCLPCDRRTLVAYHVVWPPPDGGRGRGGGPGRGPGRGRGTPGFRQAGRT